MKHPRVLRTCTNFNWFARKRFRYGFYVSRKHFFNFHFDLPLWPPCAVIQKWHAHKCVAYFWSAHKDKCLNLKNCILLGCKIFAGKSVARTSIAYGIWMSWIRTIPEVSYDPPYLPFIAWPTSSMAPCTVARYGSKSQARNIITRILLQS